MHAVNGGVIYQRHGQQFSYGFRLLGKRSLLFIKLLPACLQVFGDSVHTTNTIMNKIEEHSYSTLDKQSMQKFFAENFVLTRIPSPCGCRMILPRAMDSLQLGPVFGHTYTNCPWTLLVIMLCSYSNPQNLFQTPFCCDCGALKVSLPVEVCCCCIPMETFIPAKRLFPNATRNAGNNHKVFV